MQQSEALAELDPEQRRRLAALVGARRAITGVTTGTVLTPGTKIDDVLDLVNVARFILTGLDPWEAQYPIASGDCVVLGPGVVLDPNRGVIGYKGENYYLPDTAAAVQYPEGESGPTFTYPGGPTYQVDAAACTHCPKVPSDRLQPCPWSHCPHRALWPDSEPTLEADPGSDANPEIVDQVERTAAERQQ